MGASSSEQKETYTQLGTEIDIWSKVQLFQMLPIKEYPQLRQVSEDVEFREGSVIIRQGEEGNEFFILKAGQADVDVNGEVKATLGQGDYFGENSLLQSVPRTATITAKTHVFACKISRTNFQKLKLHEKLKFPKRGKVNLRHQMMAAGAAGVKSSGQSEHRGDALADKAVVGEAKSKRMSALAPPPQLEKKNWWKVQTTCLSNIFFDRINVTAFIFVPIGQFCKYQDYSPGVLFSSNFLAIIPLASILGQATEALAAHTGQLIGGLLNATFGNAVEMIMCIQAVKAGLVKVVQGNLLGSILSNLLLVLGMAIWASGVARKRQKFNQQGAASNMTCQLVASISVCLPTCFALVTNYNPGSVLLISRVCAVFLMIVYGMFLYFMLKTHADLFEDEGEEEEEEEVLSPTLSVLLLLLSTLTVFFCSECLVDSIEGVSTDYGLSKAFIGVILLPIVGNAAEHATAVGSAYKGMMDLALGVAVGSSTQIALFVVPCAIMFGWYYDVPMDLDFSAFDTTCQMLTVFLVSQVLSHGETTWLHGAMLCTVYIFIAVQTLFILEPKEI